MRQIGDYELLEQIGEGNYGTFFKAIPPARLGLDEELVAVKVLSVHASKGDFKRIANELRVFASLESDHLVEVYDAGHQDGQLFYAMGWYADGSLAKPSGELDTSSRLAAVEHAARGAHELHEVGVVHRDIKPANILLHKDQGKLSDLGLAQILTPGMTTTGMGPVGSVEYMEPDVIWGERAARASDVWSLGITLHRVVTGTGVFGSIPEDNILDALRHVLHTVPVLSSSLSSEVRPIIERALAAERSERYATALDFATDLGRARG